MLDDSNLTMDLAQSIHDYLEGGRGRSLSSLAKRSNVAYSTIRRIAQNESQASPHTALAIVDVILPIEERMDFLRKYFPQIGSLVEDCYSKRMRREPNDERLRSYLRREPHNRIFNIAATRSGTTEMAIENLAGQIGLEALDEMICDEILLKADDGTIHFHEENWALGNIDDALEQVKHSVDHFDKTLVGTDGAALMHATGAIRKDLLPRVKSLVANFIRDINQLKDSSANEGDIHFFCNLVYSLYDKSELKEDG